MTARDIQRELADPEAGHRGIPVDARCVHCKKVRAKRAPEYVTDDDSRDTFKHVCHNCQRATPWNVIRVLDVDGDGGRSE